MKEKRVKNVRMRKGVKEKIRRINSKGGQEGNRRKKRKR